MVEVFEGKLQHCFQVMLWFDAKKVLDSFQFERKRQNAGNVERDLKVGSNLYLLDSDFIQGCCPISPEFF